MSDYSVVGKSIPKIDARAKVTGQAVYADDLLMPGMLYGKIIRCSQHAHAKVKRLDLSRAAKAPGVVKVLGPGDVTGNAYCQNVVDLMVPEPVSRGVVGDIDDQHVFTGHVKHQNDAIAGIIATSERAAEEAAKLVEVEYEPLPVYSTMEESTKPDALAFVPEKPGNLAFQLPEMQFPNNSYGYGDVDAAMAQADLVVEESFSLPRQKQCQMEPNTYLAKYDAGGKLTCWTTTQLPKLVQRKLATLFELPMTRVRVLQTTIGGAFGARCGMINEPQACAMAMALPGRPVKVSQLREEDFTSSECRHPGTYWMKIGFKKNGEPVACDAKWMAEGGGYYTHSSGVQFTAGGWLVASYKWGAVRYRGECYFTNAPPSGAFRGYGNPQTTLAREQLIERALNQLKLDPIEWRKKWHKSPGDDGWVLGVPIASCALDECLDEGAEAISWNQKKSTYADQKGPKRRGLGVAIMTHTSGAMPMLLEHTACTVRLNEDGTAEVLVGCTDLGTGAHTTLQQIAAEALSFPFEDIHLKAEDTDAAGYDVGTHASRTLYTGGQSVIAACIDAKEQLLQRAAQLLEANAEDLELENRKIFVKGVPEKAVDVATVCYQGCYNWIMPDTGKWIGTPGQIQGYASLYPPHNSPPWSAAFAEVEVDTQTGEVKVLEMVLSHDIGKAINPAVVEGQLEGGAQQGIGYALVEELRYNGDGLCLNGNFTDYRMLGPSDMPKLKTILVEQGDQFGPYGAKSVGESGLVSPVGAVANAIYDAVGVQMLELPITPERVLAALNK